MRRLPILLLVAALFILAGVVFVSRWPRHHEGPAPGGSADDPRISFETLFRNVRPDVKYVGAAACADCHPEQTAAYDKHPMARSLAPASQTLPRERLDKAANNPFEKFGLLHSVARRGDRLFHRVTDRDETGKPTIGQEEEIDLVMGSGTHGRSFIVNRAGYLFVSPIAWFAHQQGWDLSPGFKANFQFNRPVLDGCMFCHCNQAEPIADTTNHFRLDFSQGHAIGCERCHGPGELHVKARASGPNLDAVDLDIVNPKHLDAELREDVCRQCHLQGAFRVERRGRRFFDYRPGLPLEGFITVFVAPTEVADKTMVVGHFEQMEDSQCLKSSGTRMGCVTCHDPHSLPAPEKKAAFYRARCLTCHQETSCSLPLDVRRQKNPEDSCFACHMPANESNIAHTAVTDHRIPRRPGAARAIVDAPPSLAPGAIPLVPFRQKKNQPPRQEHSRALALALMESAKVSGEGPDGQDPNRVLCSRLAAPLLEDALKRFPDDVPALEARAGALWNQGFLSAALEGFEKTLREAPEREVSLKNAAQVAEALGQRDKAASYYERLIKVDPWLWEAHSHLARYFVDRQEWQRALGECEAALRLNPFNGDNRMREIQCLLRTGQTAKADAALAKFAIMVKDQAALLRWFDEQKRR